MFDTFREPHFFTFSVIFSHIASIFTFSVEFVSHLATFSHIAAFSHLRVPQHMLLKYITELLRYNHHPDNNTTIGPGDQDSNPQIFFLILIIHLNKL